MNAVQKWIAGVALVAIAVTAFVAPYEYAVHNELARLSGAGERSQSGVTYAPMWSGPTKDDFNEDRSEGTGWLEIDALRLDTDRLLAWWAGITIVAAFAILLASKRRERDPS